jgi:hypothetical protein
MKYLARCWGASFPQHKSKDEIIFKEQRIFWWYLGHNCRENQRNVSTNIVYKFSYKILIDLWLIWNKHNSMWQEQNGENLSKNGVD